MPARKHTENEQTPFGKRNGKLISEIPKGLTIGTNHIIENNKRIRVIIKQRQYSGHEKDYVLGQDKKGNPIMGHKSIPDFKGYEITKHY